MRRILSLDDSSKIAFLLNTLTNWYNEIIPHAVLVEQENFPHRLTCLTTTHPGLCLPAGKLEAIIFPKGYYLCPENALFGSS
jgi:hypothetical protein